MTTTTETEQLRTAWLILGLALVIRMLLSGSFLLVPDEANYWQWSRYLALGYHDHPPMIAWTIWLATRIFGQNEFAVRLPTVLGITLCSVYMCLLARRIFSGRAALYTALLSQGVLLFNGAALIATPDGLLLPCWAAACYHAHRALEEDTGSQWLLTGLWFGLGLLSKYTMLLFLPSLFLCMVFSRWRSRLASPRPWLGFLLGCALFTPVMIWNARNEWATFRHVLYQGGIDNASLITFRFIADFLATQAALLSPLVFLLLLAAWLRPARDDINGLRSGAVYLNWMSLTTFVVFLLLSLHVRIYGNWAATAYTAGLVLVAGRFGAGRGTTAGRRRLWTATVVLAWAMTVPVLVQAVYPALPLPMSLDRVARETVGWDELGRRIFLARNTMPRPEQTFIFGLRYQYASELAFYVPGQPRTVSINHWTRPNVYDFWVSDDMLRGKDAVGIYEYQGMDKRLADLFDRIDPPEAIRIYRHSPWFGRQLVRTLYLVRCYGFRGGQRWHPRDGHDIRATELQTGK
ncbi:MAG TPA: glycosyltransferase family 39 protein [Desulfobulbus sp.]|nr:glycosyltransferase family 39 protein [Desulfobulbus sp.]